MEKLCEELVSKGFWVGGITGSEHYADDTCKELILSRFIEVEIDDVHLQVEVMSINGVLSSIIPFFLILSITLMKVDLRRFEADRIDLWEPPLRQGRLPFNIITFQFEQHSFVVDGLYISKTEIGWEFGSEGLILVDGRE